MEQFHREAKVLVDTPAGDAARDLLEISEQRLQFKIEKTLTQNPNTCELAITNLSHSRRASLHKKHARVTIHAGYRGQAGIIFSGDARTIDHVRKGGDWESIFKCGDGERAYQHARTNFNFKGGTSLVDVALSVGRDLGINVGNLPKELAAGAPSGVKQFNNGYSTHGPAARELTKILKAAGLSWSIQDGAIQVTRGNSPISQTFVLLAPDSGLVGSPESGAPDKKGGPGIMKARCLLQPSLYPGVQVEIKTSTIGGRWRVQKVVHTGDTHGGDWFTDLEVTKL